MLTEILQVISRSRGSSAVSKVVKNSFYMTEYEDYPTNLFYGRIMPDHEERIQQV
jgi:hypothetical protein